MASDPMTAQLERYTEFNQRFYQQGLELEVTTDFPIHADAAGNAAALGDKSINARLNYIAEQIMPQAVDVLQAFTPYATGLMAKSSEGHVQVVGNTAYIELTQDRLNEQQTAQVPPLVIGGHASRGGRPVAPNPYPDRAQPYIETIMDSQLGMLGMLVSSDVVAELR